MKDISYLEKEFIKYSEKRAEFLEKADSKNANKVFDKLFSVIKNLKSLGAPGIDSLVRLMAHNNTWVGINAAGSLREEKPNEARNALKKIADNSYGMPAAEAKTALAVWNFQDHV